MPKILGIRHIPPWEPGWRPPERLVGRCPDGVACIDRSTADGRIDHHAEWEYAQELRKRWSKT